MTEQVLTSLSLLREFHKSEFPWVDVRRTVTPSDSEVRSVWAIDDIGSSGSTETFRTRTLGPVQ